MPFGGAPPPGHAENSARNHGHIDLDARPSATQVNLAVASARYVTIPLAAALHGYTVEAIETKIARGVWTEGREYRRAPDGRILVDMRGVERWVEGQSQVVSRNGAARSA